MSSNHAEDSYEGTVGPSRNKMPITRDSITTKVEIMGHEGYITAGKREDGTLGEVFLHGFGKSGSTLEGWIQLSAMLFSIAMQYGAEFPMLARKIAHTKFEPYGETNDPDIPRCASVPDYIVRWLARHFGDEKLNGELDKIANEMDL